MFYFFILSSISCADKKDFSQNQVKIEKTSSLDHSKANTDLCSPFCSCSCCVGFTKPADQMVNFTIFKTPNAESVYLEKHYYTSKIPLYLPPKHS